MFFLNVTPVTLLNLVHEMVGLAQVENSDDDFDGRIVKDGFRDACGLLLFPTKQPGRKGRRDKRRA